MLKALIEKKNDKIAEMQALLNTAKAEERAMNEDEIKKFDTIEKEIKDLDATIDAEKRAQAFEIEKGKEIDEKSEERAVAEEKSF